MDVGCGMWVWVWVSGNNIGEEGAKALGPHLATLANMRELDLDGRGSVVGMCLCAWLSRCCCDEERLCVCMWVSGNNIGEEGAKALGPHLAKLVNMNTLWLNGRKRLFRCHCGCDT